MEKEVVEIYTDEIQKEAAARFGARSEDLKLLGDSENFVYAYPCGRTERILRITHSTHRSANQIQGELDWISYLDENGVSVCTAIPSRNDKLVETIEAGNSYFSAVSFVKSNGREIGDNEWTPELISLWGTLTGRMHSLAKDYKPRSENTQRFQWFADDDLRAEKYLPSIEANIVQIIEGFVEQLHSFEINRDSYGLVHADLNQWNFHLNKDGSLTVFDFDDCKYRWFVSDIAIALHYGIQFPQAKTDKDGFARYFLTHYLKGYSQENNLDLIGLKELPVFLKLREILGYVWFHKKWNFDKLSEDQLEKIKRYRYNIENDVPILTVDFEKNKESGWKKK